MAHDPAVWATYEATLDWYRDLHDRVPGMSAAFDRSAASFFHAYELYEHAAYLRRRQNSTDPADTTRITAGDLERLEALAAEEQGFKNGNTTVTGPGPADDDGGGERVGAVAGQTMAAKTVALLRESVMAGGATNKLNLALTTVEPLVAFAALAHLTEGAPRHVFGGRVPRPGATMVFELYSVGPASDDGLPEDVEEDLWVRFLYRNGTGDGSRLISYPLFGNGVSEDAVPWHEFVEGMGRIDVDGVVGWCNMCGSGAILFCPSLEADEAASGGGGGGADPRQRGKMGTAGAALLSPVAAGAIGAAVTLAFLGLATALVMVLGGLKIQRRDGFLGGKDQHHWGRRRSGGGGGGVFGGFRGAEKMASDADVGYAKGGARHERTGSWELRGGGGGKTAGGGEGVVTPPVGVAISDEGKGGGGRVASSSRSVVDDDAISVFGLSPVKPREF